MGAESAEAVKRCNLFDYQLLGSMKRELKKALTVIEVAELVCIGVTIVVFVVTLLTRAIYLAWK